MKTKRMSFSRRDLLALLFSQASIGIGVTGCTTIPLPLNQPQTNINAEILGERMLNWSGREEVRGVAQFDNRFLMVEKPGPMGWQFPGGVVNRERLGPKSPDATGIMTAVTEYVHSQATVSVIGKFTNLFAYGYGINQLTQQISLIYWFNVAVLTSGLSPPHANMRDTINARWVHADDPLYGVCLAQRIQEYEEVDEGGTVLIKPCQA